MKKHVKSSRLLPGENYLATTHPGQNAKAVVFTQVYRVAGKIARPDTACHQPLSGSLSLPGFHLPAFAKIDNPAD
ncbi:hypothetical protein ABEH63_01965 [Pseudomonas syringae]|uniref:hypothetical protein n=1 Tax=Pseudomonas TaxID=286 RepID=UPI0011426F9E|nr:MULTISPECIES: hypothetical protein [Pseudomonas]MCA5967751.1 hypothetical protein [Pseudomonas sp. P129]